MFNPTAAHPLARRAAALTANNANLKSHRANLARSVARATAAIKTLK